MRVLFFWAAMLWSAPAWAGQGETFLHRIWQAEEGLPNPVVRGILQTKDGYLWLGTDECLARFDGIRFTEFDRKDFHKKNDRWMVGLIQSSDGSIWASACNGGVVRIQSGVETYYTTNNGLPGDYVLSATEDSQGNVWIGTSEGIARWEKNRFVAYTNQPGLIVEATRCFLNDKDGALWIGTAKGLSRYQDGTFTSFTTNNVLAENSVMSLCQSRDGTIWIGTANGLSHWRDKKLTHFTSKHGLAHNTVRAIFEDNAGDLWVGSHGGLQKFVNRRFIPVSYRDAFSLDSRESITDVVYSITQDREGNLWVGTSVGLRRLRPQKFSIISKESGLPHEQATSVIQDKEGAVWVGTYGGGLAKIEDGRVKEILNTDTGLPSNYVLSVHEAPDGALWIGTDLAGVVRFDRSGEFDHFVSTNSPAENVVRGIMEDRGGRRLILHNMGINILATNKLTPLLSVNSSTARTMLQDSQGTLWLGYRAGLVRYKDGERKTFTEKDGLTSDWVNALYEDKDGVLWVGTEIGGLNRYKNGKFTAYGEAQGFKERILHILEDRFGRLWLATKNGVFNLNKRELNGLLDGKSSYVNIVSYGKAEGMRRAQCNGIGQPAGFMDTDGKLWFPTLHGVAVFDTSAVSVNHVLPPVVIEEIIVNGKSLKPTGELKLPPGHNDVEFHFTGLSFTAPERVQFKYKLEGIDEDWALAGTRRIARYSNLPPGAYKFRVQAANSDGIWNETGATFAFSIDQHFYQTAYFYLLVAVVLLLTGTGFSRFRLVRLKAREQELMGMVNERTKELRQEISERKQAQHRSAVFSRLGHRLSLANSLHESAQVIIDAADELIGWDSCYLLDYDLETDRSYPLAFFDLVNGRREAIKFGEDFKMSAMSRQTLQHGPQLISRSDPVTFTEGSVPWGDKSRPSASMMYVPIRHRQKTVGLLSVQSYRKNAYTENDLTTSQSLADYCAGAFERIRAEAALRESRQMVLRQERLAAVGQLAAGVAHEFNNILTVIKGHVALLQDNARTPEGIQSLQQVMTSADCAANLTRQMLAFSRKQLMQPRVLDLNDTISQVIKMLERLLGENISIVCDLQAKLPPVHADPGMMEQIILNLALNARDAMPQGGQLTIRTALLEISEKEASLIQERYAGNFIRLSIIDTGCGMEEATLQKIFEPFFTTKDIGKGTGLGLSTVYGIVKQHNGWVEVSSKKGYGTIFHIFLPFNSRVIAQASGQIPPVSIRGGTETILFVEDEDDIRKLASQVLASFGYRVLQAPSGVEALPVWEKHKEEIDLLFTDMVMPGGISGGQLAKKLRGERPNLKIVYTSGYSQEILEKDLAAEPNFKFLEKPYKPQRLGQIVREALDESAN